MKKPITTFVCLTSLTAVSQGQLTFSENFSYPAGDLAGNTNDGNNWVHNSGDTTNSAVVTTSVIPPTFSNLSTLGGSLSQTASARVSLALQGTVAPGTDETTLYISFVQQLGDDTGSKSQILEFWRGAASTNTIFSFGTDTNVVSPDYGLLVGKGSAAAVALDVGTASLDARLIVLRIDFGANNADAISVYVDPGATEPATNNGSVNFNDLSFNRLGMGSFQQGSQSVDEIRIGSTYADVVPATTDSDSDGMSDEWELANGLNVGVDDSALDEDENGGADGLTNLEEFIANTDPQDSDSDDDNLLDGQEASPTGNVNPYTGDVFGSAPGDLTNPLEKDSDGDGIDDDEEVFAGVDGFITNPNSGDTDGDNLPDKFEIDGGLDPTDATGDNGENGNNDEDELRNFEELEQKTNPSLSDTDADGYFDHVENNNGLFDDLDNTGTDPLVKDTDGDGLDDGLEVFDSGSGSPAGPLFNSDPNSADSDRDGFNDKLEVDNGTDPDDVQSFPVFPPVMTSVQFDFDGGPGGRGTKGLYNSATPATPAHQEGFLTNAENIFNQVSGDTMATLVSVDGTLERSLGIDLGTAIDDGTGVFTYSLEDVLESSGVPGAVNNANIYDTTLMEDWLFTRDDKNWVARVNGLAAGTYRVMALIRESSATERTYDAYFGTQAADGSTDPVFAAPSVGIPASPTTWIATENYHTQDVTILDNEYIVVMVDPTNAAFGNMEGLQIFPAPATPAGIDITSCGFTDATTFVIDFQGAASSAHSIGSSATLEGGFTVLAGQTATTDAMGAGQFTLTVAPSTDTKLFYQISQP